MHPRALDQRNRAAEERIFAAAQALAKDKSLSEPLERLAAARHNDYLIDQMLKREALADLMEAVVAAQEPVPFTPEPDPFEPQRPLAAVSQLRAEMSTERRGQPVRRGRPPRKESAG